MNDIDVALAAAEAGASVVRRMYGRTLARFEKSPSDFATEADLASEDAIRAVIRAERPDDAFVGEETGESPGSATGRRWLVDPLCGTLNYAAGTPLAAVNIALETADGVTAAVCADPIAGEFFWTAGGSASLRRGDIDTPMTPSGRSALVDVDCDGEVVGPQLVADREFRRLFGPRVVSTTLALAWVAAGRWAAYVSDGRMDGNVHFAAGIAVCQAAGCVVTDLSGAPVRGGRGLIAAADARTHAGLREIVGKYLRPPACDGDVSDDPPT